MCNNPVFLRTHLKRHDETDKHILIILNIVNPTLRWSYLTERLMCERFGPPPLENPIIMLHIDVNDLFLFRNVVDICL